DPDQVDADVAAVRRYYEVHGFFDARVRRRVLVSPDQSEYEIDFLIEEGPRYVINRVLFEGNVKLPADALRKNLKLTEGRYWDTETLQRDTKEVVKAYSPLGFIYQQPSVTNEPDPDYMQIEPKRVYAKDPGRVDLVYVIHEGKPFQLGVIHIKGNYKT